MFLKNIETHHSQLIESAIHLHQSGEIFPDTYVIDYDALMENAAAMLKEARRLGMKLFVMTKQIGRNPLIAKNLMNIGYDGIVCVDYREALVMQKANIKIAHVGHLVQIPSSLVESFVAMEPSYMTVFTVEKAIEINEACKKLGKKQQIMLRVIDDNDFLYLAQYGGFKLENLPEVIPKIQALEHVAIKGLTSFPCFLYDSEAKDVVPTHNVKTIHRTAALLKEDYGIQIDEFNLPSVTCVHTLEKIAAAGGTQGEPGHGLTGTTPLHASRALTEKPAYVYMSEISHQLGKKSYCYGGGHYRRSGMKNALVIQPDGTKIGTNVVMPNVESIDYYFELDGHFPVGSTVVMAFRTQIFATRSEVAVVKNISTNQPKIIGIFDSQGNYLRG